MGVGAEKSGRGEVVKWAWRLETDIGAIFNHFSKLVPELDNNFRILGDYERCLYNHSIAIF